MKIGAHCMNMYMLYMIQKTNTYRNSRSPEPAGGRIEHSPWPHGFASECLIILCYLRPYCAAVAAVAAAAAAVVAAAAAAARGPYVVISIVAISAAALEKS